MSYRPKIAFITKVITVAVTLPRPVRGAVMLSRPVRGGIAIYHPGLTNVLTPDKTPQLVNITIMKHLLSL